jgi:hypothetical protein
MTAGRGPALAAAVVTTLIAVGAHADGQAPALSARFVLEMVDGPRTDTSTGTLYLQSGANTCLLVATPLQQEMRLGPKELVIYYPERDLALVGTVSARQAPPLFEAISVALSDPTRTLPRGSTLLERKQSGGVLRTRWRVAADDGKQLGEMRLEETRDGVSRVEVLDSDGHPQRRYAFTDRLRVAGRSVPRSIDARYFTARGTEQRRETWTLSELTTGGDRPTCARIGPKTKVQELAW